MRKLTLVLAWLTMSGSAAAQTFELGAGIGRACIGDSSGFCGDESGPMWSICGSVWMLGGWEIGVRMASLSLPDSTNTIRRDDRFNSVDDPAIRQLPQIDLINRRRSRRIANVEAVYHFGRHRPVGAMLGVGFGERTNHGDQSCAPAGCEGLLPILGIPPGKHAGTQGNLTMIAGLSARIRPRVQLKGGVRLHNFAGEGTSTSEIFMTAGYRFGAS
jgi:hypothetical protein